LLSTQTNSFELQSSFVGAGTFPDGAGTFPAGGGTFHPIGGGCVDGNWG